MRNLCMLADGMAAPARSGGMFQLLIFALLFAGMWFLFIAPQRKRQKKQQEMLRSLRPGDRVVLTAGIFGKIVRTRDNYITLEVAKGVRFEVLRGAVQQCVESQPEMEDGEKEEEVTKALENKGKKGEKSN